MKHLITIFAMLFACTIVPAQSNNGITKQLIGSGNAVKNASAVKAPHSSNWYANAESYIREQEYHIQWKQDLQQYAAVNRKSQLGFFFQPGGYRVLSFLNGKAPWEFNFNLKQVGSEINDAVPVTMASPGKLLYRYPGYAVEYLNDSTGMRQNFIVNKKTGEGLLEIAIGLEGNLQATVEGTTTLVLSSQENGRAIQKMNYDGLRAWDKNQQPLTTWMELNEDGKTLMIKVDDANAVYPITVDPLNHTEYWSDNGSGVLPALDVLYGSSVSDAGDVNNDGFDDIIIGAPANINVLSGSVIASVGQAFIYLGSATGPAAAPSITLQSSTTINALFGYSVSKAGDINGDGFDDVIVGAPGDQVTLNFGIPFGSISNNIGKVYIYYGNATPASVPGSAVTINLKTGDFNPLTFGLTLNPLYGFSVSDAGDVNNDGYDDVIVGSPLFTDLGSLTLAGRATVYLGSGSGINTAAPIHRNAGLLANSLFGFSVSRAGDMNNDGADEVLIGAPGSLSLLPGLLGRAYVYPGIAAPSPGGIASSPVTYTDGGLLKTLFGFSVSNAGDVNNDGFDDIVIGQPATIDLSALVTVGKVDVFFGAASLTNKTSADVLLKSPRDPDILGIAAGNLLFGFSVSGGKDVDCDGIDDIIVGEPGGTALGLAGINAAGGQAYIYYGRTGSGPSPVRGWELKQTGGIIVANLLGNSVSMAGDVNNDGSVDILVGASNGTLNLSSILSGLVNFVFVQSVGSAYVHSGCITPSIFTLPVTLSYFNGYLNNNEVLLKWQTVSEQNYNRFEVERSVNGDAFRKLGTVTAKGSASAVTNYDLIDKSPATGTNAYRLKYIDNDGKFSYSPVVLIRMKTMGGSIAARTNAGQLSIEFNNVTPGDYVIELFNMNGALLQKTRVNIAANDIAKTMSLPANSSKGMYIIKATNLAGNGNYHDRIMIP